MRASAASTACRSAQAWRLASGVAQQERRVERGHDLDALVAVEVAAQAGDRRLRAAQALGGELAQRDDHARLQGGQLLLQERLAGADLVGLGVAVVGRAALDDVADVDVACGRNPWPRSSGPAAGRRRPRTARPACPRPRPGASPTNTRSASRVAHAEHDVAAAARQLAAGAVAQLLAHHRQGQRADALGRRRFDGRRGVDGGRRARGPAALRPPPGRWRPPARPARPDRSRSSRWVRNPAISSRSSSRNASDIWSVGLSGLDQRVERQRVIEGGRGLVLERRLATQRAGHAAHPARPAPPGSSGARAGTRDRSTPRTPAPAPPPRTRSSSSRPAGRLTKPGGMAGATRSRSQAPMNGVAPSAARMDSTRVAVVEEKSNRPSRAAGSEANGGSAFMPNARSTNERTVASSARSFDLTGVFGQVPGHEAGVAEGPAAVVVQIVQVGGQQPGGDLGQAAGVLAAGRCPGRTPPPAAPWRSRRAPRRSSWRPAPAG